MTSDSSEKPLPGRAVPADRLSRMLRLGGMAGGIAGGMLLDGARQFAQGKRPSLNDLLMTPANAVKVTNQLAQLRGAAMKVGQLLSMDAGELLPPELAEIMSRLRADADPMPPKQLQTVLNANWGNGWLGRFAQFNVRPIAAASIGQVHRARTKDGRDLAIKVQYPGVRASIDSDVNNVASLMRMSRQLPATLDIAPMLAEAKRQLHEEADYTREASYLARFGVLLADAPEFLVPKLHPDLSTNDVLAMEFIDSVPLDQLATAPQETRDRIMTRLIALLLKELFDFQLMQTDPNFANYRYRAETDQLVLLDFGATREFGNEIVQDFRKLMVAGLENDTNRARQAMMAIGFFDKETPPQHQTAVLAMFDVAMVPLRTDVAFDFGTTDLATRLRDMGLELGAARDFWHLPPMDALFLQRKFAGMYLLAAKLRARVNVRALLDAHKG